MDMQVKEILPIDVVTKLMTGEDVQVIDVREPDEWEAGHIAQAILIPLGTLPAMVDQLPKEKPIILVCRSGSRSHYATEYLQQFGYDVSNMIGGMLCWPGEVER